MKLKKKKSTKSRKTIKKRRILSFYSKGKSSVYIMLLVVVILGSILLAQGLTPKSMTSTDEGGGESILISEAPQQGRDNLQLDTLKFRKCSETAVIDLLLDRSGSMGEGGKLSNLKNAIKLFTNKLSDNSVLGIQSFSDPNNPQRVDIPISYYKDVRQIVVPKTEDLYAQGSTYMRNAFEMTKNELFSALDAKNTDGSKKFPDKYKFNLIFISDGIPELLDCGRERQQRGECSAESQSPIKDPDISQQIKDRGIKIFTIAYLYPGDDPFNAQLENLMKTIASKDDNGNPYYFRAPINNELTDILAQISSKFCSD